MEKDEKICKHLIKIKNNNSGDCDDYDDKHLKINVSSHDNSPLEKTLEMHDVVINVRSSFNDKYKCYPQVFLDECLYKSGGQKWVILQ